MSILFAGATTLKKEIQSGKVGWRSPSNIALIKYWGKHGNQLPQNPSISFTLSNAFTETIVSYSAKDARDKIEVDFTFEGVVHPDFQSRIVGFLEKNIIYFPFIKGLKLSIDSYNSFPHSSGIASSASAMSALALCLVKMEESLTDTVFTPDTFLQKISYLSRLASGSASRSVYPKAAIWGHHDMITNSSDEYAVPFDELHPIFETFHDDILIVSKAKKSVSSTAGHNLMNGNVFAPARYEQARTRFAFIIDVLKTGDLDTFGKIVEDEALTLHALMMCSDPSYILIESNTLEIIKKIRAYRKESKVPVYFTLDAGPNIHLLYPDNVSNKIKTFIEEKLRPYCEDGKIIADHIGLGPTPIDSFTLNV